MSGVIHRIRPTAFPSTFVPFPYPLITLSVDNIAYIRRYWQRRTLALGHVYLSTFTSSLYFIIYFSLCPFLFVYIFPVYLNFPSNSFYFCFYLYIYIHVVDFTHSLHSLFSFSLLLLILFSAKELLQKYETLKNKHKNYRS